LLLQFIILKWTRKWTFSRSKATYILC